MRINYWLGTNKKGGLYLFDPCIQPYKTTHINLYLVNQNKLAEFVVKDARRYLETEYSTELQLRALDLYQKWKKENKIIWNDARRFRLSHPKCLKCGSFLEDKESKICWYCIPVNAPKECFDAFNASGKAEVPPEIEKEWKREEENFLEIIRDDRMRDMGQWELTNEDGWFYSDEAD